MIIWLNGAFGAGKTTTAKEVTSLLPDSRLFDTEKVGEMLWQVLGVPEKGFQDFPPWRGLVVETARQVLDHVGGTPVATQTVLVESSWQEIHDGLTRAGVPVHHVLPHTDRDTLVERIETDSEPEGAGARQDHLTDYERALPRLRREARVVDTKGVVPAEVAETVLRGVRTGL